MSIYYQIGSNVLRHAISPARRRGHVESDARLTQPLTVTSLQNHSRTHVKTSGAGEEGRGIDKRMLWRGIMESMG